MIVPLLAYQAAAGISSLELLSPQTCRGLASMPRTYKWSWGEGGVLGHQLRTLELAPVNALLVKFHGQYVLFDAWGSPAQPFVACL